MVNYSPFLQKNNIMRNITSAYTEMQWSTDPVIWAPTSKFHMVWHP